MSLPEADPGPMSPTVQTPQVDLEVLAREMASLHAELQETRAFTEPGSEPTWEESQMERAALFVHVERILTEPKKEELYELIRIETLKRESSPRNSKLAAKRESDGESHARPSDLEEFRGLVETGEVATPAGARMSPRSLAMICALLVGGVGLIGAYPSGPMGAVIGVVLGAFLFVRPWRVLDR